MQEAVGHLFQAAAVFHAADQAAQYGEQADLTASCNLVNLVVQDMLLALTGKYDRPSPQVSRYHKHVYIWTLSKVHASAALNVLFAVMKFVCSLEL